MPKSVKTESLNDPVAFAEAMFGVRLWSTQKEILRSIESNRRTAVKSAHSTGKTMSAALLALWYVTRYEDARVFIIAPGWLRGINCPVSV